MTCLQKGFEALSSLGHRALTTGSIGLLALGLSFTAHSKPHNKSRDRQVTTGVRSANVVWGSFKRAGCNVVWGSKLRKG